MYGLVNDQYKVDGIDFKKLPLKVACYARTRSYYIEDEGFEKIIASMQDFIEKETSWKLVDIYSDSRDVSVFNQNEFQELLEESGYKFDVIVVPDFFHITESRTLAEYIFWETELAENHVPIFSIEDGIMISGRPKYTKENLLECDYRVEVEKQENEGGSLC